MEMEDHPREHASDLRRLAEATFPYLSRSERELLDKVSRGEWAIFGPSRNYADPGNDPKNGDHWGRERHIEAALVAWLCTDQEARKHVHCRGIQIFGARISGLLDLPFVSVSFQLALERCQLKEGIDLRRAEVAELDLQGSKVEQGITANGLYVRHNVLLRDCDVSDDVELVGAQIGGNLACGGATFDSPPAKNVPECGVAEDANRGAAGPKSGEIGGDLSRETRHFFTRQGQRRVPSNGTPLNADGIDVKGDVLLRKGFKANGEVRLMGAQIGRDLECDGGTFCNPPLKDVAGSGMALNADGIDVKGYVFLRTGFHAKGEVRFLRAHIGRNLECDGGTFSSPPLKDVGIPPRKDVSNPPPKGISNPPHKDLPGSGKAFNAERADVRGSIYLRNRFTADGAVDLHGAEIGGTFDCRNGNFEKASLDLTDASAGSLKDSGLSDWPHAGKLFLDGFVYGRIEGQIKPQERLRWLRQAEKPFRPQPYLQLAKILHDSGDSDGALQVREKMAELHRSSQNPLPRLWSLLLKWSIGYGYHPGRAIRLVILLSLVGWVVYSISYKAGTMVPTDKDAHAQFTNCPTVPTDKNARAQSTNCRTVPGHYPAFSALVYSLETSLPLVHLGQADKWQPDPGSSPPSFASARWFVMWFHWIQIMLGWLLATLFVAGVSGIVHKE
jgi:hypothetical protein